MIKKINDLDIITFFKNQKIIKLQQIASFLDCSIRTAQRKLKSWKVYRSYNKNGQYFSLLSIPKFDSNGIWNYKNILFSKHGSLKETVIYLVNQSEKGLTASEICKLLKISVRSMSSYIKIIDELCKKEDKGSIIYYANEESVYKKQETNRKRNIKLPSDPVCISILIDLIKHPGSNTKTCAQRMKRKGIKIKEESINKFLIYHQIEKKTLDML